MAGTIKGITIQIEGKTSGLTKSLQEVESQIKKDDAALKNLNKALELDPTNVDLLAAKEAVLADRTDATAQKLEILKQVQSDALTELPDDAQLTASQMAELSTEIAMTESTLNDLSSQAENASGDMSDVGSSAEEAGAGAEDSSESFIDFGDAAETAGEVASAAMDAVVVAVEAVVTAAVAAGAAIGAAMIEAGSALVNTTMNASALADELLTTSSITGLTTDTLQELNYASELLDVNTETVTGSMTKLLKTMSSAADGSSSAMEKFTDLGLSIYDTEGNLRSSEDVFWDAVDVLGQIENESERDAAAMDLFGRSARELNPLIEAGSEGFATLADEARSVGYVMDGDLLNSFGALDDNMQRMDSITQAVSNSFGQVLLPILTDMSGDAVALMGDFSAAMAGAGGDIDQIGTIIEQFAPQAVSLIEEYIPQILTIVEQVFGAILPLVVSLAPQLISLAGSLLEQVALSISENADSFISAFESLFNSVVESAITLLPVLIPLAIDLIMTLTSALIEYAPLLIEGALSIIETLATQLLSEENILSLVNATTEIVTALLGGLTSALPILIPAALDAILTIVDTLLSSGSLGEILNAALTLITTLASSLIDYLPVLIGRLPEIILGIVQFLTGDGLPSIIEAGFTLITGLIGALPEIIVAILGGLAELIVGMVTYITGDGADDILEAFQAAFDGIIAGASTWGSDIIQNLIDGISSMISSLTSCVSGVAETIADFLHFSEPEKGPLSDFNESGSDMMKNYIESMESQRAALEAAVADTAGIIAAPFDTDYSIATSSNVHQTVDYTGGLSRIEQAITSQAASAGEGSQIVIPIYIGSEHVDTLVVDALDRYNYQTGGH